MPITNAFTEDDAYASGNDALIAQAERLADRKQRLKTQMANVAQVPQGQMVSGHYVKPSMGQQFAPIVGQALIEFQQRAVDRDASELDRRAAAAATQHLTNAPGPNATPQERMQWAQAGTRIPGLAPIMQAAVKDLIVSEPARQDAREDRRETKQLTIEEARRKQEADQEFKREQRQQQQEFQAQQDRMYRRTADQMAAAVRSSGGGGGDKASNYQIITGDDGTLTRVNKLTGETEVLPGRGGKSQASLVRDQLEERDKRQSASRALEQLNDAEALLKTATGSKIGSIRDTLYAAAGMSSEGAKAAAQLDTIAGNLASNVPRLGGATSDADLKFYKEQAGQLGNRELPVETRLAALKQVRKFHERSLRGPQAPTAPLPSAPTIRQAVEAASNPSSDEALLNKYLRK